MSTNFSHAQLLARTQQTAAMAQDFRVRARAAQRDATMIEWELARPVRPDLPTVQGSLTPAGAPVVTTEHTLGSTERERDEIRKNIEEMMGQISTRAAKLKIELAAAAERSDTNGQSELPSGVQDMVKVAQGIMRGVEAQSRLPSIEPEYEHQDVVRETPEFLSQERIDYATNLERTAQLEASLDSAEQAKAALEESNAAYIRQLHELQQELTKTKSQLSSQVQDIQTLHDQVRDDAERIRMLEGSLAHMEAKEATLIEELTERNAVAAKVDWLGKQLEEVSKSAREHLSGVDELARQFKNMPQELEPEGLSDAGNKAGELPSHPPNRTDSCQHVGASGMDENSVLAPRGGLQDQMATTGKTCAPVTDLEIAVAEMCAHMTGKKLEAGQWVDIWAATRVQVQILAEKPSTRLWAVGQNFTDDFCDPQVSGLPMLCLHLVTAIRAGEWGNEAIALVDLLMKELNKEQPLPVNGLLLVVSAAVDGARAHADEILLLAIWQLAVYLHEAFSSEPRFGLQRKALDGELQHSPWCQKVTQAIATGSVAEMCGGENGQLWSERGIGVVYGARIHLFVAFNVWEHRIWLFCDAAVKFVTIPRTTSGIIIPGVEEPLLCLDEWWLSSYYKY